MPQRSMVLRKFKGIADIRERKKFENKVAEIVYNPKIMCNFAVAKASGV